MELSDQKKLKILIIAYAFPPHAGPGVQRVAKFVKYLPEWGIEPIVLTIDERDIENMYGIDMTLLTDIPDTVSVARIHLGDNFISKKIKWIFFGYSKACSMIKSGKIDLVYCSGGPFEQFFIPFLLNKKFKIRYILDYRDPWIDNPYFKFNFKGKIANYIYSRLEPVLLKNASFVTCVSKGMLDFYHRTIAEKIHYIPNGFDEDDFKNSKNISINYQCCNLVYTGTIAHPHCDIAQILELLEYIIRQHESISIKLHLIGYVSDAFRKIISDKTEVINHVIIHGYLPHNIVNNYQKNSDVLILQIKSLDHDKQKFKYDISGKIYEYIAAGKPILAIVPHDGEAARIINETNTGIVVDSSSTIAKIGESVLKIIHKKYHYSPNFHEVLKYSRKAIAYQLAILIKKACF